MRLSKGEMRKLTLVLEARHGALLEEIRDELERSENQQYVELIDRAPADIGDKSVADALADLNVAIVDRHVEELRDIEAAKKRMDAGTFGVCSECGDDIGVERLLAYPTAKRCVACQRRRESTYAYSATPSL